MPILFEYFPFGISKSHFCTFSSQWKYMNVMEISVQPDY
jgi:hypothetical protein